MATTNNQVNTPAAGSASGHGAGQGLRAWLVRRRVVVLAVAVAAVATALALGQHWLALADLVPLLFVLPCAAMMFMCMKGMNHDRQAGIAQDSGRNEAPTGTNIQN